MKEKLDKYIKDNMEKETKCYKEISLKDLLETSFYANEKGELVGEFTLTRINQIADVLTYLNEDVRTGKEINYELEKENVRLKEAVDKEVQENTELKKKLDRRYYKNIIDRAIEYIQDSNILAIYKLDYFIEDLLNILTGGDEE